MVWLECLCVILIPEKSTANIPWSSQGLPFLLHPSVFFSVVLSPSSRVVSLLYTVSCEVPTPYLNLSLKASQDLLIFSCVWTILSQRKHTSSPWPCSTAVSGELLLTFGLIIHSFVVCGSSFLEYGGGLGNFLQKPLIPKTVRREDTIQYTGCFYPDQSI